MTIPEPEAPEIPSIVKVKPREYLSKDKQANKALILKGNFRYNFIVCSCVEIIINFLIHFSCSGRRKINSHCAQQK